MRRAHHSHYVTWCELGRTAFMRERGISYSELEDSGVLLPVSRMEIEYRKGVGFDHTVHIETRVERVRSRSIAFAYRLLDGSTGELLATARTELVCTSADGRPRRLPPQVRESLETLEPGARDPARGRFS